MGNLPKKHLSWRQAISSIQIFDGHDVLTDSETCAWQNNLIWIESIIKKTAWPIKNQFFEWEYKWLFDLIYNSDSEESFLSSAVTKLAKLFFFFQKKISNDIHDWYWKRYMKCKIHLKLIGKFMVWFLLTSRLSFAMYRWWHSLGELHNCPLAGHPLRQGGGGLKTGSINLGWLYLTRREKGS